MSRRPAAGPLLAALCLALSACAPQKSPPVEIPPQAIREIPPKVGLALGGGAARGFAEIGVLRVLEQEKIPVDLVAGTSVGSLIGALYADLGRVLDAEFLAVEVQEEDLFDYKALALLSGGLVKGERLEAFLSRNLRHKTLETLPVPFYPVAVDIRTGQAVVFERGSVAQAVHASCAIPGVFVPVQFGGATYVDGGVLDPVPADVARQKGAEVVIGVAIPAGLPSGAPRNPVEVAFHSAMIMYQEIGRLRAAEADVVIEPDVKGVAFDDFSQKKRLIEAGEAAARAALPAIREAIARKTRRVPVEATP
ncbi:MAG: patatin-like phospholipase family protein [Acidobacteriota bacterium]